MNQAGEQIMSKAIRPIAISTIIAASALVAFAQSPPYDVGYGPYYPAPGYYSAVNPSSRTAMVDATSGQSRQKSLYGALAVKRKSLQTLVYPFAQSFVGGTPFRERM
jgi:hypothetical protein